MVAIPHVTSGTSKGHWKPLIRERRPSQENGAMSRPQENGAMSRPRGRPLVRRQSGSSAPEPMG